MCTLRICHHSGVSFTWSVRCTWLTSCSGVTASDIWYFCPSSPWSYPWYRFPRDNSPIPYTKWETLPYSALRDMDFKDIFVFNAAVAGLSMKPCNSQISFSLKFIQRGLWFCHKPGWLHKNAEYGDGSKKERFLCHLRTPTAGPFNNSFRNIVVLILRSVREEIGRKVGVSVVLIVHVALGL